MSRFPPHRRRRATLPAVAVALALTGCLHTNLADKPAELARTWDGGKVYLPGADGPVVLSGAEYRTQGAALAIDGSLPVVVYMHGCSGLDTLSHATALLLVERGYAVVQPNSYARQRKPDSCKPALYLGGLHRGVLPWRHAEASHAIRTLRGEPWVDQSQVYLMGLSEGAITTATYAGEPVTARVVEGWTCHAGWHEYRGLNARQDEAVLSLLGVDDPWFLQPELRGNCGVFMDNPDSRMVLFQGPHILKDYHYLLWHPSAQRALFEFLEGQRS